MSKPTVSMSRICNGCGTEFESVHHNTRYCSIECRYKRYRELGVDGRKTLLAHKRFGQELQENLARLREAFRK